MQLRCALSKSATAERNVTLLTAFAAHPQRFKVSRPSRRRCQRPPGSIHRKRKSSPQKLSTLDLVRYTRASEIDNLMMYGGVNGTQEVAGSESAIYDGIQRLRQLVWRRVLAAAKQADGWEFRSRASGIGCGLNAKGSSRRVRRRPGRLEGR